MDTHAHSVEGICTAVVARVIATNQAAAEYAMITREALDEEDLHDRLSSHAFEIAKREADLRRATKVGTVAIGSCNTRAAVCLNVDGWYVRVAVNLVRGTGRVVDDERAPSARAVSL